MVFSFDYSPTTVSALQSSNQLAESASSPRLVWMKIVFWKYKWIISSSVFSSVVDVLAADKKRKGRPTKPDRPSATEKKFPCEFCQKRYGTKQSLQVNDTMMKWNDLSRICISGSCFYEAQSREEGTARPFDGNLRFHCLRLLYWFYKLTFDAQ